MIMLPTSATTNPSLDTATSPHPRTSCLASAAHRPSPGPYIVRISAGFALVAFLGGCTAEVTPAAQGASAGSTGSGAQVWPKRVTLETTMNSPPIHGVRLADGATAADEGDLSLTQAQVLSISSPTAKSLCEKGIFPTLADIPTEIETCPASLSKDWQKRTYLSAATLHTSEESESAGMGILVRNEEHSALYRLRVVGDSYDAQGLSTATFDYEPVP